MLQSETMDDQQEVLKQPLIGAQHRSCQNRCAILNAAFKTLQFIALIAVVALVFDTLWLTHHNHNTNSGSLDECEEYVGADVDQPFSVILTADPGDFSGTPEAHYIIANLKHKRSKPRDMTVCAGHFSGTLMGQPVIVVTTGIGPPAAGLCTLEIVSKCGPWVKEIVYFGTSGWSPARGGILNPPQCSAANTKAEPTRLGDVCISPFSVNWTCKKATWAMQAGGFPNQCVRPAEVNSPNATYLYGECQFYADNMHLNLALADDLLDAARAAQARGVVPRRTPAVNAVEHRYWDAMRNATRVAYPAMAPDALPRVFDYTQCMEVDGQFFYSGVPWELKARDYAAETLTAAFGKQYSATEVVAVSAMEGIGVSEALLKFHKLATSQRRIPYTHVRTLSNWLHQPVAQVRPGHWEVAEEIPEDFVTGYGFAIATGSATILSLYQARCETDVERHKLPPSTDCSFNIDYDPTTDTPSHSTSTPQDASTTPRTAARAAGVMKSRGDLNGGDASQAQAAAVLGSRAMLRQKGSSA